MRRFFYILLGMFTCEKKEAAGRAYAAVTGYDGTVQFLNVPEQIDGLPAEEIGDHAFSGRADITNVCLPKSIRILRGFAFHNCPHLRELTLHNGVTDYSDGVIKGCLALKEILVHADADGEAGSFESVKRMLNDSDRVLRFTIRYPDGEAALTFPDYTSEAQEDSRARAIHQSIEGAGYAYRECVRRGGIDYREYDRLFDRVRAIACTTAENIAFDRLMYPYRLTSDAKAQYETYLRARIHAVLLNVIRVGDTERAAFLAERGLIGEALPDDVLQAAAQSGQAQITALLMAGRQKTLLL